MIHARCDKCTKELNVEGGLAFSPPIAEGGIDKYHLCLRCWALFVKWINEKIT
jgi:hypothetical protein